MIKAFSLLLLGLVFATAQQKVNVTLYTEAGWPYCQKVVTGNINDLINADGLQAIMNFDLVPFGNNYFVTQQCGGSVGDYSSDTRHCWSTRCYQQSDAAPDCYNGTIVTQHAPAENLVNRYEACAKHTVKEGLPKYWPFIVCMESNFEAEGIGAAKSCASSAGLDWNDLQTCFNGPNGIKYLTMEARNTPDHPGVPYAMVNGQEADAMAVLKAVCTAYTGTKPAGCASVQMSF